jgi:hypothetical protein
MAAPAEEERMRRHFVNKQSSRSMVSYLNCYKSHRTGCALRDHSQIASVHRINLWTAPQRYQPKYKGVLPAT